MKHSRLFWVRVLAHSLTLLTETFIIYWVSGNMYSIMQEVEGDAPVYDHKEVKFAEQQSGVVFWTLFGGRAFGCIITGWLRDYIKTSVPIIPILQLMLGATTISSSYVHNITLLYVMRFSQGLFCTSIALTNALIGEWVPDNRKIQVSISLRVSNILGLLLANYYSDFLSMNMVAKSIEATNIVCGITCFAVAIFFWFSFKNVELIGMKSRWHLNVDMISNQALFSTRAQHYHGNIIINSVACRSIIGNPDDISGAVQNNDTFGLQSQQVLNIEEINQQQNNLNAVT